MQRTDFLCVRLFILGFSICTFPAALSLRGSAVVLHAKTRALEAKLEDSSDETLNNGTLNHNLTIKTHLTGNPQVDYILDPNLPRELNGYNLTDYPFYNALPQDIDFNCDGLHDGFYASVPHKCQVYHHCLFGTRYDFLCANYTAFDQKTFICHFVSEVDCINSPKYFKRNEALYKESSSTTTSTTTKPTPSTTMTVITTERSENQGPKRGVYVGRRRPFRRRQPIYDDYYYDDEYDYLDDYYAESAPDIIPANQDSRKPVKDEMGASEDMQPDQVKPNVKSSTSIGSFYSKPRTVPKIKRPVPKNERAKYEYNAKSAANAPSSTTTKPAKAETFTQPPASADDYYYDDEEYDYELPFKSKHSNHYRIESSSASKELPRISRYQKRKNGPRNRGHNSYEYGSGRHRSHRFNRYMDRPSYRNRKRYNNYRPRYRYQYRRPPYHQYDDEYYEDYDEGQEELERPQSHTFKNPSSKYPEQSKLNKKDAFNEDLESSKSAPQNGLQNGETTFTTPKSGVSGAQNTTSASLEATSEAVFQDANSSPEISETGGTVVESDSSGSKSHFKIIKISNDLDTDATHGQESQKPPLYLVSHFSTDNTQHPLLELRSKNVSRIRHIVITARKPGGGLQQLFPNYTKRGNMQNESSDWEQSTLASGPVMLSILSSTSLEPLFDRENSIVTGFADAEARDSESSSKSESDLPSAAAELEPSRTSPLVQEGSETTAPEFSSPADEMEAENSETSGNETAATESSSPVLETSSTEQDQSKVYSLNNDYDVTYNEALQLPVT